MPTPTLNKSNPPWRYRLLVRGLSPLLFAYTGWRALKDGGKRYWQERLGFYSNNVASQSTQNRLWVHAASVGEVITILPLLKRWLNQSTDRQVLFTTGTPTGAQVIAKQNLTGLTHQYLPIDTPGACKRFLKQANVSNGWIVETEIWPWLFAKCAKNNVCLTIVNGRLSDKTSRQASGFLASSYRHALKKVRVLSRSEDDKQRFESLGATPELIHMVGNLKYAGSDENALTVPIVDRRYVLAASTHADEELILSRAWKASKMQNLLLVIAPRHPERGAAIAKQLSALSLNVCQRSNDQLLDNSHDVYIVDTLGELENLYQHALATYVGGSLIARGGHNIMEPARHACPTIVGPHMFNFKDMMEAMVRGEAIATADSEIDVIKFFLEASESASPHTAMAERARSIANQDKQAVLENYQRYLF